MLVDWFGRNALIVGRPDVEILEWALLEYVAFYGLTLRARNALDVCLPNSLALEQEWAAAKISALSTRYQSREVTNRSHKGEKHETE